MKTRRMQYKLLCLLAAMLLLTSCAPVQTPPAVLELDETPAPTAAPAVTAEPVLTPTPMPAEPIGEAQLVNLLSVEGTVTVHSEGTDIPAYQGMRLLPGDRLTTGENSFANLDLDQGRLVMLSDSTSIELTETGDHVTVQLTKGSLINNIDPGSGGYTVTTPSITMGVLGTVFRTSVNTSGVASVDLFEGGVSVSFTTQQGEAYELVLDVGRSFQATEGNLQQSAETGALSTDALPLDELTDRELVLLLEALKNRGGEADEQLKKIIKQLERQQKKRLPATPKPTAAPTPVPTPIPTPVPTPTPYYAPPAPPPPPMALTIPVLSAAELSRDASGTLKINFSFGADANRIGYSYKIADTGLELLIPIGWTETISTAPLEFDYSTVKDKVIGILGIYQPGSSYAYSLMSEIQMKDLSPTAAVDQTDPAAPIIKLTNTVTDAELAWLDTQRTPVSYRYDPALSENSAVSTSFGSAFTIGLQADGTWVNGPAAVSSAATDPMYLYPYGTASGADVLGAITIEEVTVGVATVKKVYLLAPVSLVPTVHP